MKMEIKNKTLSAVLCMVLSVVAMGQDAAKDVSKVVENQDSDLDINVYLAIIAGVLLLPIYFSAKSFLKSAKLYLKSSKTKAVVALLFISNVAFAAPNDGTPFISSSTLTYVFITLILLEILLITLMNYQAKTFLSSFEEDLQKSNVVKKEPLWNRFLKYWSKVNNFVPIEKEKDLDTGHNYDGIRELDNVTPPWFKAAFVASIIFAIVYLYTHHVSHSSPNQIEEFELAMKKGEEEKAEYLANQSNNIDENNVTLLSGADIDAGKTLFAQKCAACHKENAASAPGGIGPNLTDDFWIHGGSLKNIFASIKNGWPDKGMIAWKEQLSPKQMAQIASFVKSAKGTVSAGGKEPQGDLYVEDSSANVNNVKVDTLKK